MACTGAGEYHAGSAVEFSDLPQSLVSVGPGLVRCRKAASGRARQGCGLTTAGRSRLSPCQHRRRLRPWLQQGLWPLPQDRVRLGARNPWLVLPQPARVRPCHARASPQTRRRNHLRPGHHRQTAIQPLTKPATCNLQLATRNSQPCFTPSAGASPSPTSS